MELAFPKPTRRQRLRKPLTRSAMKRRPPRRLARPDADPAYLAWVRTQPCCLRSDACEGPIEAHHAGKNPGVAMKAPDATAVPLCRRHHRQITDHTGVFAKMARAFLRAWQDMWIAATRSRYTVLGT